MRRHAHDTPDHPVSTTTSNQTLENTVARTRSFQLKVTGIKELKAAAQRIRSLPEVANRAAYRAANAVAEKAMTQARRDIAAEINLPQGYIREQMSLVKASPGTLTAEIRVRMRAVRLARFAMRQMSAKAKGARGDALRGISKGRKQAGVSVKVGRKEGRKRMPGAFLLPLRSGLEPGGNGMGVFVRTGKGRDAVKHLYGPSPAQLFARWRYDNREELQRQLVKSFREQLRYELTGSRRG